MGTDNLFWKRKSQPLKRKSKHKGQPKQSFLIVCEGEKTEPNYFKSFRLHAAFVVVKGCGANTKSLINETLKIIRKEKKNGITYDQVWCVFDRDDFPLQNFNAAIDMAQKKGIKTAYSNESFELWYLLHFQYYDSSLSRHQYRNMLKKHLKHAYRKNSLSMYKELFPNQEKAIKNAEKLFKSYQSPNPGKDNPSTTVHLLVKELNRFLPKPKE